MTFSLDSVLTAHSFALVCLEPFPFHATLHSFYSCHFYSICLSKMKTNALQYGWKGENHIESKKPNYDQNQTYAFERRV